MAIQRSAIELRQHIDLIDLRIDTIRDRYVNESIFSSQGHSRLGSHFGQRIEAGASTTSKNDGQNAFHVRQTSFMAC